jgi:hypothetical protein
MGSNMITEPQKPTNAYRVTLKLTRPAARIDQVLREALRSQKDNLPLKVISRLGFKDLFKKKKIRIKGQPAVPSSSLAEGTTYVDILGYGDAIATDGTKGSQTSLSESFEDESV